MMPSEIKTVNLGLSQWKGNEYPKRIDFVNNNVIIDEAIGKLSDLETEDKSDLVTAVNEVRGQIENLAAYGVASGTNTYTAIIAGITALIEGFTVRVKFTNANTGASTLTINSLGAKAIVKGNGTALSSGNIKVGQICNLAYTGSNFQLLGEGGEYGTATASDVLSGKTIGTDEGIVTGTMSNRGTVNQNLTTEGQEYTIPSGYHNGLGKIKAVITGLVASVIKAGATVGGVVGTFTSDATTADADVLFGKTYYRNGFKGTGSIPSKSSQTYTPGTTAQTIAAGQYLSGNQTIEGSANLVPENIKKGVNIFGKIGTIVESIDLNSVVMNTRNGSDSDELRTRQNLPVYQSTATINSVLFCVYVGFSVSRTITATDNVIFRTQPVTGTEVTTVGTSLTTDKSRDYNVLIFNPRGATVTIPHNGSNFNVYEWIKVF